jgi:hypothetical protein
MFFLCMVLEQCCLIWMSSVLLEFGISMVHKNIAKISLLKK